MTAAVVLFLAMGLATWAAGWWGVLLAGALWGLLRRRPSVAGLAAGAAWLSLFALDGPIGAFRRLAARLGGILGVPGWALILVTLLYPILLAWSAARLSRALRPAQGKRAPDPFRAGAESEARG
ncbi:MAG TPA: hypothetical protein VLD58_12695 [Gemmatimonadales bacterium]|nr:hypothetical protein [Gemmatimonadales bacterium]